MVHHYGGSSAADINIIDGRPEAYFRGRRLEGKEVRIPVGFRGLVVVEGKKTYTCNRVIERQAASDEKSEMDGIDTNGALDEVAAFDEVIVWGHDTVAGTDNSFVRCIDEWVTFAEHVSSQSPARHRSSI